MPTPSDHAAPGVRGLSLFRTYTLLSYVIAAGGVLLWNLSAWAPQVPVSTPALTAAGLSGVTVLVGTTWLLAQRLVVVIDTSAPPRPGRAALITTALGTVVFAALVLRTGAGHLAVVPATFAAGATVTFVPRPRRDLVIIAIIAGVAAAMAAISSVGAAGGEDLVGDVVWATVITAAVIGTILLSIWSWDVAARLDAARRTAAELAIADERLRFAADLHDIQGHHLQVIALKSELAARLAAADPVAAVAHMREVNELALEAQRDVRRVVQGFRRASLRTEVTNALRVLDAAGVRGRASVAPDDVEAIGDRGRRLLALVVREATTNVIRHAAARSADVTLTITGGRATLAITNDGASGEVAEIGGLGALADRLGEEDGDLTWRAADGSFTVMASVPATTAQTAGEVVV